MRTSAAAEERSRDRGRSGPIAIREAATTEIPLMQAIERDAARRYGTLADHAFCVDLPAREVAEHERVRRLGRPIVAEIDREVIGFLLARPLDGRAHVLEAAVLTAAQQKGCGRRLLAAFHDWGRTLGFEEATLTTFRDVPWNAPFYARLGYAAFEPGIDRGGLRALIAEEEAAGFARAPRVAMRRPLALPDLA